MVVMKSYIFGDTVLCGTLKGNQRFGGPFRKYLQGWRLRLYVSPRRRLIFGGLCVIIRGMQLL
jgi:hypothetical protein